MTCPSVSSFLSLLATRLYAAVDLLFLIIYIIILIFWRKVKGARRFLQKKVFGDDPPERKIVPEIGIHGRCKQRDLFTYLESLEEVSQVNISPT